MRIKLAEGIQSQSFKIEGFRRAVKLDNGQFINNDTKLGKALIKGFRKYIDLEEINTISEPTMLVEEPIELAVVTVEQTEDVVEESETQESEDVQDDTVEVDVQVEETEVEEPTIMKLEEFTGKDAKKDLKTYALETFEIELKGNKSLETLYSEMIEMIKQ